MSARTVLAFDLGEARVGVAVGNTLLREATPLKIVPAVPRQALFDEIAELLRTWQPELLVVGLPRDASGEDTPMTARSERFANQLGGRFNLPVVRVDERYSTLDAESLQREARQQKRARARQALDDVAAAVILKRFLTKPMPMPDAESAYQALRQQLVQAPRRPWRLVGIHSGGVWVARRLALDLAIEGPIGELDIAYYRDDFNRIGLHATSHPTHLPFEIADANLLLVDDVLYTGRTIRGALNVLFDYGRPASVELAALFDRGERELPFAATYCGAAVTIAAGQTLVLNQADGRFSATLESSNR